MHSNNNQYRNTNTGADVALYVGAVVDVAIRVVGVYGVDDGCDGVVVDDGGVDIAAAIAVVVTVAVAVVVVVGAE